jgi:AcrR family transcriptional regulator
MSISETDGRRARGEASRRRVLAQSTDLASTIGLDALSIGRLAETTGRSKSSIATLFGTKEALQLATVDAAAEIFRAEVVEPARAAPRGLARLVSGLTHQLAYSRGRVFAGGCFFQTCAADKDAAPPAVRDALRRHILQWEGYIEAQTRAAFDAGELRQGDARTVAFTLLALYELANARSLLTGSEDPYRTAASGMYAVLVSAGAAEVPRELSEYR